MLVGEKTPHLETKPKIQKLSTCVVMVSSSTVPLQEEEEEEEVERELGEGSAFGQN